MPRLLAILTGAALVSSLALAPTAAAQPEDRPRFCTTLEKLDARLQASGAALTEEIAARVAKALRTAAKKAPKSLKKVLRRLARGYDHVADGGTIEDLVATQGTQFSEASARYALYYAEKCLGVPVPSTRVGS